MPAIKKITGWIPNSITCCNLLSGCLACIFAFRAYETIGALRGWQWTCVFIGAAAVFDFLDGAMARLLKAYSKLGAELDSLSDLVSFGVAPAFLIFNIMGHFSAEADAQTTWLQYAALAVPVLGALRLARFNVMDVGDVNFHGLPIPSAAIFLIGVAGWINDYYYPGNIIIAVLTVLIAVAMVGRFRMFSLKFKNFSLRDNFRRYILLLTAAAFIVMYGLAGFAWTIIFYFLLSVLSRRKI